MILVIDAQGFPCLEEQRLSPAEGAQVLQHVYFAENGAFMSLYHGEPTWLEPFDQPLVTQSLQFLDANQGKISMPFAVEKSFALQTLQVDEWDRFHGLTTESIPFVLSPQAQDQLFDLCSEFDDDSITVFGRRIPILPLLSAGEPVDQSSYWTQIYQRQEEQGPAPWDLGQPSPVLVQLLNQVKLPKSRILVLGSGPGHDAAYFAQQGHLVTAVDFSAQALLQAQQRYGSLRNIQWVEKDILHLPREWQGQFDVICEHTCYCAIDPQKRAALSKIWRQMLTPNGHLLGIFFAMEHRHHPPFGATEWEIRQRLQDHFHFIFWGRWRESTAGRQGKELAVYAQKKGTS